MLVETFSRTILLGSFDNKTIVIIELDSDGDSTAYIFLALLASCCDCDHISQLLLTLC